MICENGWLRNEKGGHWLKISGSGRLLLINVCMYVYRFQNVFLRCPTPRLHCFLSSHWPSLGFFRSWPSLYLPSSFSSVCALFCFGIHFNPILGNLPSAILWTWSYHISWFCSIYFIIVSSNPLCCLVVTFLILSFLDILEDIHLCSFDPSFIIFCESPFFRTIQYTAFNQCIINV